MKKRMLIGWVTIAILLAFGTSCFAFWASNVANTTKRGSFLIFPLVKAGTEGDNIDTIVSISNDGPAAVSIQCYYKYPQGSGAGNSPCECVDFGFKLTAYQEISFSVKTGLNYDGKSIPKDITINQTVVEGSAELKCFAVNNLDQSWPISWNFLKGEATISEGDDMTWQYPAWRFAVGEAVAAGGLVNVKGKTPLPDAQQHKLLLTGTNRTYDACPSKLIFPFIQNTHDEDYPGPFTVITSNKTGFDYRTVENNLTLVPCKQDCWSGHEGNNTITTVEILVYDEYENKSSGAWACVGCEDSNFYSESLRSVKLHKPSVFTTTNGGPPSKVFTVRASGCADSACNSTAAVPVVGVISHQFYDGFGPIAGETPTSVPYFNGADNNTYYGQGWLMGCDGDNLSIPVTFTYR